MTSPSESPKRIVDVHRTDDSGIKIVQTFRLPTPDDWQNNLISLNNKILKKFNIHSEYAFCINKNTIAHDDYKAFSDIVLHSDSEIVLKIEIVNKNTSKHKPSHTSEHRRKIQIYSDTKQHTVSLPVDIHQFDDAIYTQLITQIRKHLNITHNFKLYEKCVEKRLYIDDWADLYETLQDTKITQPLRLYVDVNIASHTIKEKEHNNTQHFKICNDSSKLQQVPSIYQHQSYVINHINNELLSDRTAKLVLLGDSGVGKSSIEHRFVRNKFVEGREPTIGALFSRSTLDYGAYRITFEIWDTAGQERFRSLAPLYYRNACAALIVYDITEYRSYDSALKWIKELQEYDENIVIGLCGNKLDLYENRKISYKKVKEWVFQNDVAVFGETSAKTDVNITQMFRNIGEVIAKTSISKDSGFHIKEDYDGHLDGYGGCYSYCGIV